MFRLDYFNKTGSVFETNSFESKEEALELLDKLVTSYNRFGSDKCSALELYDEEGNIIGEWENKEMDAEPITEEVTEIENDIAESDSDRIADFIEDLYNLRKESIATEGEYGLGNLVFKEFRNLGYLDNLKEVKRQIKSKELSLEQLKEEMRDKVEKTTDNYNKMHGQIVCNKGEQEQETIDLLKQKGYDIEVSKGRNGHVNIKYTKLTTKKLDENQDEAKLNDNSDDYLISEYRRLANIDESVEITEENIDEQVLNSVSCHENQDVHELRQLLLGK